MSVAVLWGGSLGSRVGRLDVAVARLADIITLPGVEALANPKSILGTEA